MDYIPLIPLKYFDISLMSVLVWVHPVYDPYHIFRMKLVKSLLDLTPRP